MPTTTTSTTEPQSGPLLYPVDTATPTAGGTLRVGGSGWLPGSTVDVELHSTPVHLGSVLVDQDGGFLFTATIPADTPPGSHEIVATGTGADRQPQSVSSPIDVVAAQAGATTTTTAARVTTTTTHGRSSTLPLTGGDTLALAVGGIALVGGGIALAMRRRRTV